MKNNKNNKIKVEWEYLEDPDIREHLRKIFEILLRDDEERETEQKGHPSECNLL